MQVDRENIEKECISKLEKEMKTQYKLHSKKAKNKKNHTEASQT